MRLLCFPYAGGGASVFQSWQRGLPDDIEVCAVQLPGRENRIMDLPHDRLSSLLPPLVDALHRLLDTRFAVFGHSMGALIGFEFARYIRRQLGLQPVHLFVSSHKAPQLAEPDQPLRLDDAEVLEELRRLDGTPREILENEELRRLVLSVMRADLSICRSYEYSPDAPLDCAISAFGGLSDPEVSRAALAAWRIHTSSTFALQMLPGGHFFIRDAGTLLLETISQELRRYLDHSIAEIQMRSQGDWRRPVTRGAKA
jgi:medium-chain acyl-[acyl-carrier-protein] hydrolase